MGTHRKLVPGRPDRSVDNELTNVVARVPAVITCLDSRGRPVSMPATTLSKCYTNLVALVRAFYVAAHGGGPAETVEVSFREERTGVVHVDFAVVDRSSAPRRWLHRRDAGRAQRVQGALMETAILTTGALEVVALLVTADRVEVAEDGPDFLDVRVDGKQTYRYPRPLVESLRGTEIPELVRGTLAMFTVDSVVRMVIGKDPEIPGRYQEAVISRSPELLQFLDGTPLSSLVDFVPVPGAF